MLPSHQNITAALMTIVVLVSFGCQSNPLLRKQGLDALKANEPDRAEQLFRRAVKRKPTDWRAHYLLGRVLLRQKQALEAQHVLEKTLSLRQDQPEERIIIDELAEALFQQGEHQRMAELLLQACRQQGSSYDFRRQGRYLAKTGDVDGAVLAYRKAARFAKGDVTPYLDMAALFESIGDRHRAMKTLKEAYALFPNHLDVKKRLRQYGQVPGPTMGMASGQ